ncbi:uncharacterized protein LOC110019797 isoform X3 [Phalaenopsis equestris]|uniref:uncharacterized protein LOC110019797 isoform X3 n=1 Tax=Phalaenopsis equestris TaxID=78828 RepID=UPI0009E4FCD6|nr:uncharacterized protein LOC110019797 isoform X3 [Phalaenopsis equestris]
MGGGEHHGHGHGEPHGAEDFRLKVWSMTGGPNCRPKYWRRNTAIAMFGIFLVCIPIAMKSAELEVRLISLPPILLCNDPITQFAPYHRSCGARTSAPKITNLSFLQAFITEIRIRTVSLFMYLGFRSFVEIESAVLKMLCWCFVPAMVSLCIISFCFLFYN